MFSLKIEDSKRTLFNLSELQKLENTYPGGYVDIASEQYWDTVQNYTNIELEQNFMTFKSPEKVSEEGSGIFAPNLFSSSKQLAIDMPRIDNDWMWIEDQEYDPQIVPATKFDTLNPQLEHQEPHLAYNWSEECDCEGKGDMTHIEILGNRLIL